MCGRYSQSRSAAAVAEAFGLATTPAIEPRYNIAPTQPVSVILATPEQPTPHHELLRWGLVPSWAKDIAIGSRMINARSETVSEKPSFRAAFKRRRCLVVADGFYEWQLKPKDGAASGKSSKSSKAPKQPYYFHLKDQVPFAFAGLWEQWTDPQSGAELDTCTILTTAANEVLEPIHDRMPVILPPDCYGAWIDPDYYDARALQSMLSPYAAEAMERYPVSPAVNSPRNDRPECLEPLTQS